MPMTYNTIPTVSTGDVYSAAAHNALAENANNYRMPPMVKARRASGLQSIATATFGAVNFDTEDLDTDAMFAATRNYIEILTTGVYLVTAGIYFAANATGIRQTDVVYNPTFSGSGDSATITAGVRIASVGTNAQSTGHSALSATGVYSCTAADRIGMIAYQSSGGALNIGSGGANITQTFLSAVWIGQAS